MKQMLIQLPDAIYEDIKLNCNIEKHTGELDKAIRNGKVVSPETYLSRHRFDKILNSLDDFAYIHCHRSKYKKYFAFLERCKFTEKDSFIVYSYDIYANMSFLEWVENQKYEFANWSALNEKDKLLL